MGPKFKEYLFNEHNPRKLLQTLQCVVKSSKAAFRQLLEADLERLEIGPKRLGVESWLNLYTKILTKGKRGDFDKHWNYVNTIAPEIDPILTIEEPIIRPHRGRPRGGGRNRRVPFPDKEQQNTQSHDTSTRREPSQWELAPPTRGRRRNQGGLTNRGGSTRGGSTRGGSTRGSARGGRGRGRGSSTPGHVLPQLPQPHTNTAHGKHDVWQLD